MATTPHFKNVLYVWQSVYPWEVRIEKLATSLRDAGVSTTVLARHPGGAESDRAEVDGVHVLRVGNKLPRKLSSPVSGNPVWYRAVLRAIDETKPDLVIARDLPMAEMTARAARKRGVPVIMDMAEHYPGAMRSWKKYAENPVTRYLIHTVRVPDRLEARAVRQMDGVITVCEEQNDRLVQSYGLARDKIQVVNNSPRKNWFERARKGVEGGVRIFGHHGHMTPERGLNLLLDAFADLIKTHPEAELRLAGSGESSGDVESKIRELGLQSHVKLTGRFKHSDLVKLYGDIDVGVLPYPPNELINHTLSNKIFDYFSCGKPVITSAASPMRRLIDETGAGVFFEPWETKPLADAMRKVMGSDVTTRSKAGLSAFETKYHWEADFDRFVAFANRLV